MIGTMRIKVERRYTGSLLDKERGSYVYDIYHNVSFFRPLFKKWIIDRMATNIQVGRRGKE